MKYVVILVCLIPIFYITIVSGEEWGFRMNLDSLVWKAQQASYIDEFSSTLRTAIFSMEKNNHFKGTCAPAYNELRQIFYDSGELTPISPIQEFEQLKTRLEHWQLPPMFCGE